MINKLKEDFKRLQMKSYNSIMSDLFGVISKYSFVSGEVVLWDDVLVVINLWDIKIKDTLLDLRIEVEKGEEGFSDIVCVNFVRINNIQPEEPIIFEVENDVYEKGSVDLEDMLEQALEELEE